MAVCIRLKRMGTNKVACYHVVAADSRRASGGLVIERLGHYDPEKNPPVFQVDADRVRHWISKGAKPSETVGQLITRFKVLAEAKQEGPSAGA